MIEDCTAIILAGGDSQRMGSDKASLLLDGQTLLQRVTVTMRQVFPKVMLSVRQPRAEIGLPQVCDDPSFAGPLAGLASGLAAADTAWVFAVGCDMPFVVPEVIELLGRYRFKPPSVPPYQGGGRLSSPDKGRPGGVGCQAVVPVVQGHPQPLAAFYARSSLEVIRAHLDSGGKNSLRAVLERLDVCYVDESALLAADPALRSFFDLDTPQDVIRAKRETGIR
ncbi:MAG: molybdenum cofactor guanylyltransferase [Gallionella sp.]